MTPRLETRRLLLLPLQLDDADQTQALFPQWEIVRYLAKVVPWPYPPDGALTFFRDVALPRMEKNELWAWTLRLKTDPANLIGHISLMKSPGNNRGFWIAPPWQRQGLITEAVEVVTGFWFNTLGFPLLRIPKAIPNVASRRISENSGMRIVGREDRDYVSGRFPSEIWEITAEEWNARRRCQSTDQP
ncbi:MAG TPA: GNAT family N-acetyltransferase [Bryobacteraceae bacterium]|jgi:RimJ/RimL family protein N-acetyltransferase|nr:GNAT family N-acetyltransferase [Bryobacteraceae bacterium]